MIHELIEDVDLKYHQDDNTLEITITDVDGDSQSVTASVTASGTFRFSIKHPEDNKKYSYHGIFHKNSVLIYPIYGVGVISNNKLPYEVI